MKTPERFTNAVTKLYTAFHKGELNLLRPCFCAVGNLCNNSSDWFDEIFELKSCNIDNSVFDKSYKTKNPVILSSGYSAYELGEVEKLFSIAHGQKYWENTKEQQFKGLCAVVEYLCELEGIHNIMDYTALFETENDKPKHELTEVF